MRDFDSLYNEALRADGVKRNAIHIIGENETTMCGIAFSPRINRVPADVASKYRPILCPDCESKIN